MESRISARPGLQKTTKSFEKAMRRGGKGSEKRYANFLGGIPGGSLTRFGAGPLNSDLFGRPLRKPGRVPDSFGPKMTTESFSRWQDTKPQNSSRRPYIDLKMQSVIASLCWAKVVAFI
jgi:hypothetical protein